MSTPNQFTFCICTEDDDLEVKKDFLGLYELKKT